VAVLQGYETPTRFTILTPQEKLLLYYTAILENEYLAAYYVPYQSTWSLVHQCEGDAWTNNPHGGLGFMEGTWIGAGGARYGPFAGAASPLDQMRVANLVESPPPFSDTPAGGCHGW
jgi:hypothetical protein